MAITRPEVVFKCWRLLRVRNNEKEWEGISDEDMKWIMLQYIFLVAEHCQQEWRIKVVIEGFKKENEFWWKREKNCEGFDGFS